MKILITGGTGFVGQRLIKKLFADGHDVVILTRNPEKARLNESTGAKFHRWDGISEDVPADAYQGVEAVINLMGENIANKRWSDNQKSKLKKSRIDATRKLVEGCEKHLEKPLKVFISASASGFYPVNTGETLDESSNAGSGFLSELCQEWEKATEGLTKTERKIISRTGVILGPESGALNKLLPIFKMAAGGPIGSGNMVMSWIHVEDMVKAFSEWLVNDKYNGVYNMVAPNPVTNKVFTKALGKAVRKPAIFPVPSFMLKLIMGEMSTIVLDSQKLIPKRLIDDGFQFNHPEIEEALIDLVR
jgi:uncharacterized protein (TIGR01777 family)